MDRVDALTIVNRIEAAWPHEPWRDPRITLWVDTLETLDAGTAGTVLVRFARTHPKAPSIAEFTTACHQLHTRDASTPATRCTDCDGTGYVEATDANRHAEHCIDPHTCNCHAVIACSCTRSHAA